MYNPEFESEVERESESTDLPEGVRAAMWAEAYDRGHSAGLEEVGNCYVGLIEFTRTIYNFGVNSSRS